MPLTDKQLKNRNAIVSDKKKSVVERKKAFDEIRDTLINPLPPEQFDPETFDPMSDEEDYEVKKRPRVLPPARLPTFGMKPKQIMEGQMIGCYEGKQDLYLLIAWLSERVSDLEDEVKTLRGG